MDQYTNKYHPDYIPGTYCIYADKAPADGEQQGGYMGVDRALKTDGDVVLFPQPLDSVNDPLNWNKWRKYWHLALVSFFTAFTAATSNSAGSAQDSLNLIYGILYTDMNTGAGILFIGIGYGCFFLAPLTSLYGRRFAYIFCLMCSIIGCFWFGSTKDTTDSMWLQLFVGISEAAAEAQVQLSLSDIYFQHQLGAVLTVYIFATSVGVYLGPLVGGYEVANLTFRAVGNVGGIMSCISLAVFYFGLEESYFDRARFQPVSDDDMRRVMLPPQPASPEGELLLGEEDADKAKAESDLQAATSRTRANDFIQQVRLRLSAKGSRAEGSSSPEPVPNHEKIEHVVTENGNIVDISINVDTGANDPPHLYWKQIALFTPTASLKGWGFRQYFKLLWLNVRTLALPPVILGGVLWGWEDTTLTFYLTTEDDVYYDEPWSYSDKGVALMNVPCLIGAIIGCFVAGVLIDYYAHWIAKKHPQGIVEAETRLHASLIAAVISPLGYLVFGIGTAKEWTWHRTYWALGCIGFGWGALGDIAMLYLEAVFPELILEGMVGVAVINNTLAMIFTFACSYWLDALGTQNTYIALAVIKFATLIACVPFMIWGKGWRVGWKNTYLKLVEMRDKI